MDAIRTNGKDGIKLEEYKGVYSLTSMREGSDGEWRAQWAKYQLGRDKEAEKAWPVKVTIGDAETAIETLSMLIKQIDNGEETPF